MVATAALLAGFGAALVAYGPLGVPLRQLGGTSLGVPPKGVIFGNASEVYADQLNLVNASGPGNVTWNWTNASGGANGPCSSPFAGILNQTNDSYIPYDTNNTTNASAGLQNLSATGNSTTLVCLNSVYNGTLNATWYYAPNGTQLTHNSYDGTNWVANGSSYNSSSVNVPSCSNWTSANFTNWTTYHMWSTEFNSYVPCQTYFEMNNNTTFLTGFNGTGGANNTTYNNTTLWSPGQYGYAPNDLVWQLPVIFTNGSINGTYEISVSIEGVTPVAQTFYFNDSIGNTTLHNDTVLFTFDMTAAWLMDLTIGPNGTALDNNTSIPPPIYGSIGTVSVLVTECIGLDNMVCPLAAPGQQP